MIYRQAWTWIVLFFLGAYHGVNPGMGWLLAVASGMERRSGRAVWQSLVPIAAGHALAIGVVVSAAVFLGAVVPAGYVKVFVAGALASFGLYQLIGRGHRHRRIASVGFADLTIWSFLMASAHGAGLMILPFILGGLTSHGHHHQHMLTAGASGVATPLWVVLVHTFGYLLATGTVAFIAYRWVGLDVFRRPWINLDLIWGVALIVSATAALMW